MSAPQSLTVPGYRVLEHIGNGAQSTIWKVRDRDNGRIFALKRVVKRQPKDSRFLEQAANEYEVGSQFNHRCIRRVHRISRLRRWLRVREIHLVMEYCPGVTVQEHRPQSISEIVDIFGQIAPALAHMNSRGYVHADMKPNNIILGPKGTLKIIDLGQSCRIGTVKTRIQGTPDFMAPEQVRRLPLDDRTDVFNFGASIYWTLTGKPIPTALPSRKDAVTLMTDLDAIPPELLDPAIPPALAKLVSECIRLTPSDRPKTMHEVTSRLTLVSRQIAQMSKPPTEQP